MRPPGYKRNMEALVGGEEGVPVVFLTLVVGGGRRRGLGGVRRDVWYGNGTGTVRQRFGIGLATVRERYVPVKGESIL